MAVDVLMPSLSPTMKYGTIVKWLKQEGERVESGDVIAEIETDKAVMELEACEDGIIGKILAQEKTTAKVNDVIAILFEIGDEQSALSSSRRDYTDTNNCSQIDDSTTIQDNTKRDYNLHNQYTTTSTSCEIINEQNFVNRIKISPLAKKIAIQNGIDISKINGTGPYNRIIKADIEDALKTLSYDTFCGSSNNIQEFDRDECNQTNIVIPLSSIRKTIGERLLESKQTIPHFYLDIVCNVDKLIDIREQINHSLKKQEESNICSTSNLKISVNDIMLKAIALALRDFPEVNTTRINYNIKQFSSIDICFAVSIDGGVITPILRNADNKTIVQLSKEVKELATKARKNMLKPQDYQGGSITVSNLGMYKVDGFHAIINPPQSCIIAIGSIKKEPIVINDSIVIGSVMRLSISCDHTIVDGVVAAKYLQAIQFYIENPWLIFL